MAGLAEVSYNCIVLADCSQPGRAVWIDLRLAEYICSYEPPTVLRIQPLPWLFSQPRELQFFRNSDADHVQLITDALKPVDRPASGRIEIGVSRAIAF